MTPEARIGFIFIFLLIWAVIGVFPWAVAAVRMQGRGALHLLPLVILAAVLAGIIVPLVGARDVTGFTISLFSALFGAVLAAAAGATILPRLFANDDSPRTPRPRREGAKNRGAPLNPSIPQNEREGGQDEREGAQDEREGAQDEREGSFDEAQDRPQDEREVAEDSGTMDDR